LPFLESNIKNKFSHNSTFQKLSLDNMKKTRKPYRKVQSPSLSSEQLDELLTAFKNAERQFKCPICNNLSGFTRQGYSVQDPTQPIFVCKSCKRQSTSYEVYQVLCSTINMDVNSQQAIEPSTNFQQPGTSDPRDKLIAQLTQQAQ
jgi:transposase-like protein